MKHDNVFKRFLINSVWLWLAFFALIPNLLVFVTSLLQQGDNELVRLQLTFNNYVDLFNSLYFAIFLRSFYIAGLCTIICLILGYPFAYFLARASGKYKNILLMLVVIPFWTSSLIRTYAIIAIIKTHGILNSVLLSLGIIHQPLHLLYTDTAALIGLIYNLLPFMILPLYANIEKLDMQLIDAARDLGANKSRVFFKVLLPLTLPGIIAGSMLVFLPAVSMFYITNLLGGAKTMLIGNLIQNQFLAARNWPLGSAVSIALTLLMGLMLCVYWRTIKNRQDKQDLL
jgi:spermidine/putrescine transport system permease protein